jgi:uncharacterized delta-60 repeat protein
VSRSGLAEIDKSNTLTQFGESLADNIANLPKSAILRNEKFYTWNNGVRRLEKSSGNVDQSFNTLFLGSKLSTNRQPVTGAMDISNDTLYLGGDFSYLNIEGPIFGGVAKLNSDGALSGTESFYSGMGNLVFAQSVDMSASVLSLAVQNDGKIILGGDFDRVNGSLRRRLIRLNADGTQDMTFYNNLGPSGASFTSLGFNDTVRAIRIQADGKILIAGSFTNFGGQTRNRLIRLNSNGTEDTTFYTNLGTGFNNPVFSIAVQSDGKILVGGAFTTLNVVTNRLCRLNSNGSRDSTFTYSSPQGIGFNGVVRTLAVQSDNKILLAGDFGSYLGSSVSSMIRLNSNGTFDISYPVQFNSIYSLAVQSDQKVVAGGDIRLISNVQRPSLVRFNNNGTLDTSFSNNLGTVFLEGPFLNPIRISSLAINQNGEIREIRNGEFDMKIN